MTTLAPGRRPWLDGVRALAVTAVVLYHGGVGWMPGGFLGVDAFFVLSGYLITSLLLKELDRTGRIDLWAFWGRRARRLLPALLAMLAAVAVYGAVFLPTRQLTSLRDDAFATLLYVANWRFIFSGTGYFAQFADPSLLLHTWSLAIEEQFYLVWPLVVLALAVKRRRKAVVGLAVAVAAGSAGWMALLSARGASSNRLYFGTDTRAQSLLVGAALAGVLASPGARARLRSKRVVAQVAGMAALVAIVTAGVRVTSDTALLYRGGFAAFALAVAVVLAAVECRPRTVAGRLLSIPPLPALGRVSYGVYLWHWPVFRVMTHAHTGLLGLPLLAARIAVTLAIAATSYRYLEQPVLRGAINRRRLRLALPAAFASASAIIVGCTATSGVASNPSPTAEMTSVASATSPGPSRPPSQPPSHRATASSPATAASAPSPTRTTKSATPTAIATRPARIVLLGDSVAMTLGRGLPRTPGVTIIDDGILGCGVTTLSPYRYFGAVHTLPPECAHWSATWRADVAAAHPNVVAVLVGRWEVMDQQMNGAWTHIGEPGYDAYLRAQLEQAFAAASSTGASVVFLTAPYYHRGERPDGGRWPEDDPSRVDAYNTILRSVVAQHPGKAGVVDLGSRMNGGGTKYTEYVDGVQLRYDGVHVTPAGARWLAPWLVPQLVNAARQ